MVGQFDVTRDGRRFLVVTVRARQEIRCTFCCWPPGPLARRERRAYPVRYVRSEQHRQRACGPQPGGARRRAGICFVAAPRRCTPASPASRRLASARPALAPKCTPYFLTGPKVHLVDTKLTNRSSFVSWPRRPCHETIVARPSRP